MKDELVRFFNENEVATICCLTEGMQPHCFNCYYAFDAERKVIIFKSSKNSYHNELLGDLAPISGTILSPASSLMKAKGMQFSGKIITGDVLHIVTKIYYKKYALAYAKPGDLWAIQLEWAKFTNNTLGIGVKQEWFLQS
ncbi:hypothetical protein EIM50_25580 [Pseudoxanthomonas sp. SGD-10]|nr:hypothetical protein EIM50_25580 [Pseudoxanthomonas sp. SGD-10]